MPDRILVTGAGGFIGTHLVAACAARGARVVAASRHPFDAPAGVERHVGELREPRDFAPLLADCHGVVHLASSSTPGSSAGNPLAELDADLHTTLALLHALQARPGIHLLYVSSGGNLYPPQTRAAGESVPTMPRSYHGAGKAAAEQFIMAWCAQYGANATILRPSNVYGPGQSQRVGFAIVPTAMRCALHDEILTIWGDGSAVRDYLYIDDFIALCLAALDRPDAGCRIFNAASGRPVALDDLLAQIEAVSGKTLHRTYTAPRTVDVPGVDIDPSAASRRFGWYPAVALRDGLTRTWAWLTAHPH